MLVDGLIAYLKANAGVLALVGENVFDTELPRGYTLPAAVLHIYNGLQEYDMSGPVDATEDNVQLDAYGRTGDECRQVRLAVEAALAPYVGTLPDGTTIQGCFLERKQDMPFMAKGDAKGIANRTCTGYRIVSTTT